MPADLKLAGLVFTAALAFAGLAIVASDAIGAVVSATIFGF